MSRAPDPGPARGSGSPDRAIWVDGSLRRGADATISLFDRGARDGEGLFETLRCYEGIPFAWDLHLERLVVSAAELSFPVPAAPATLRTALDAVLAASGLREAAARVTITRGVPGAGVGRRARAGAGAWVEAEPLRARLWRAGSRGGRAILSRRPFRAGPIGAHKTTSRLAYHLARDEARARRADEALLVDPEGGVLEGAVSNVFAIRAGRVITPPLELGILPGITRRLAIALCTARGIAVEERTLPAGELVDADEVFLTSSVQEIVPLEELEGRRFPSRETGEGLAQAYRELVAREIGGFAPSTHRG